MTPEKRRRLANSRKEFSKLREKRIAAGYRTAIEQHIHEPRLKEVLLDGLNKNPADFYQALDMFMSLPLSAGIEDLYEKGQDAWESVQDTSQQKHITRRHLLTAALVGGSAALAATAIFDANSTRKQDSSPHPPKADEETLRAHDANKMQRQADGWGNAFLKGSLAYACLLAAGANELMLAGETRQEFPLTKLLQDLKGLLNHHRHQTNYIGSYAWRNGEQRLQR